MTKQEWLQRCAARYVEKGKFTQAEADNFAGVDWILVFKLSSGRDVALTPEQVADDCMEEMKGCARNT